MRGAPQSGFAVAIRVTRARISAVTRGRPTEGRAESRAQYSRKRRRCQRRTVSGVTITSDCLQPVHTLASPTQKSRSVARSFGRADGSSVDGELLAQGEILEGELTVAADEEGEEPKRGGKTVRPSRCRRRTSLPVARRREPGRARALRSDKASTPAAP